MAASTCIDSFKENVMSSIQEQLAAAAKAHFETQYKLLNTLTTKAFEGVEKVMELNVDAAKSSLQDATAAASEMTSATDPQTLAAASASRLQPSAEKMLDYNRRLAEIGESVYSGFTKAAEEQIADSRSKLAALVAEAEKNAPPGSENAIAVMKAILSNADASYEQMVNSTRQAIETLKNTATVNATAAAERFSAATGKTGEK
jgi:phasin family protein